MNQSARHAVYALKRQFPLPVDVYFPAAPSINFETGVMGQAATKVHIKRAVLLPDKSERSAHFNRAYIRFAVGFAYGNQRDLNTRSILIDLNDLSAAHRAALNQNCWLVFEHARYEVKEITRHEHAAAVVISCVRLESAPANEELNTFGSTTVDFTGSGS